MEEIDKERPFILLTEEEQKTITETIRLFGKKRQILKLSEEAAELSAATSRYLNSKTGENLKALISEMADVQIMIYQFLEISNACPIPINQEIENKIKRLEEFKEKEKQERRIQEDLENSLLFI